VDFTVKYTPTERMIPMVGMPQTMFLTR